MERLGGGDSYESGERMRLRCTSCGGVFEYGGDRDRTTCARCGSTNRVWRAATYKMADNQVIRALAEGPLSGPEVPGSIGFKHRPLVQTLKAPAGQGRASSQNYGRPTSVHYLPGDDRAAMRKFIEVNEKMCVEDMKVTSGPLRQEWGDERYAMLYEQMLFLGKYEEVPDDGDGE